jgi:hypothetical protein
MKVVQVHSFNTAYLAGHAARHPRAREESYEDQFSALMADGFSACHLFACHLDPQRFEARLIVGNDAATQRQWAKEAGLPETMSLDDIVRAQIESWQPEVLYLSDPVTYDSDFIDTLNWRPRVIIGWRAASIPPQTSWREFDALLSNHSPTLEEAIRRGAKAAIPFQPGFPRFIADALAAEPEQHDVVFCGSWSAEHATRNKVWADLAIACAAARPPIDLHYHLMAAQKGSLPAMVAARDHGPVFGMAMHRALKGGRICMNAMIDLGQGMSANMRLFEIAGTGAFQLMEHHADIGRFFEPGREIVTYRDANEMMAMVRYYLDHPTERLEIARRGQERCLKEHGMERRAVEFGELIERLVLESPADLSFGMIGARKSAQPVAPDPVKEELRETKKSLKASEKHSAKLEQKLASVEQKLASVERSWVWKFAKPLFALEKKLRG